MVDQRVSLGVVGDVFEVMDVVRPKSTRLTGSLGLYNRLKNLGRHSEHDCNFPSAEQQGTDARDPDKPGSAISSAAAKFGCDVKVSKQIFLGLACSSSSELAPSVSTQNREPEKAVPTGTNQEPTLDVSDSSVPLAVSIAISLYLPSESANTDSLTLVRHLAPPAGAQARGASVRRRPLLVARILSLLSSHSLIASPSVLLRSSFHSFPVETEFELLLPEYS
jgi:hypothetical protein